MTAFAIIPSKHSINAIILAPRTVKMYLASSLALVTAKIHLVKPQTESWTLGSNMKTVFQSDMEMLYAFIHVRVMSLGVMLTL